MPADAQPITSAGLPTRAATFFERNTEPRAEIIEGLIREQQLVAFAGPFGVGKSPVLADIVMHVLSGRSWCGRAVEQRPVIHFDLETPAPVYKANLRNIAARLGVDRPRVPDALEVYLEHDRTDEENTGKLLAALEQPKKEPRLDLIEASLRRKPNALVIIDPLELLFGIDTGKKQHVLWLYAALRRLLSKYAEAAMGITFNLRKWTKKDSKRPSLLTDPREWMEEVCGSLDILNRSDVRLGMDIHDEDVRVINGIRRGEEMHPLLIRPISAGGEDLAGFELCPPDEVNLNAALSPKQRDYWTVLPESFRFDEVAGRLVPRASLSRLLERARSLGIIERASGAWQKKRIAGTSCLSAANTSGINAQEVSLALGT